jgi:hypothetical protein
MTRQWSIRAAVAACTAVGLLSGPVVASADPYVGLGDSYTAGPNTYANSLYSTYQSTLGANEFVNLASPGATSSSILSSQVPLAETQINDADDTKAVTVLAGGNDILGGGPCSTAPDGPGCNLRANLAAIFDRIAAALVADPATFIVGLYPNPSTGTGSALEAQRDLQALGQNLTLDANDTGANAGLNDIILKEASDAGAIVVNPYPIGTALTRGAWSQPAAGTSGGVRTFRRLSYRLRSKRARLSPSICSDASTTATRTTSQRTTREVFATSARSA